MFVNSIERDPILWIPVILAGMMLVGALYTWLFHKKQNARAFAVMAGFFLLVFVGIRFFLG